MHLESVNNLTVNDGINGSREVPVMGVIVAEQLTPVTDMNSIFSYQYIDNTDPLNPIVIESKSIIIDTATQQTLYQAVKGSLPDINVDYSAWYKQLLYESFRLEMAQTFQIPANEINIVA
jgi:hypothetical protein